MVRAFRVLDTVRIMQHHHEDLTGPSGNTSSSCGTAERLSAPIVSTCSSLGS
jgi:hypothetical protein